MKLPLMFFLLSILIYPSCQIIQKMGLRSIPTMDALEHIFNPRTFLQVVTNPYIILAVFLLTLNFGVYLVVLSNWRVSYAYPFGAVAYIVAAVMAYFILHEPITVTKWLGILIITIGVFLINYE